MYLMISSSCNPSTMSVIFLTITADVRDVADYDGGNIADAYRDDANNEDDQHTNREIGYVSPANSNPGQDGRMFYMRRM